MAAPKIFVSHSTLDTPFAKKLVDDLNGAGAVAWLDVNDVLAGDFMDRINAALKDCEWFVLVLTRNALNARWVPKEVNVALNLERQGRIHDLIFVKAGPIEHHEVPPMWSTITWVDGTADYQAALNRVCKAVGLQPITSPVAAPPDAAPTSANSTSADDQRHKAAEIRHKAGVAKGSRELVPIAAEFDRVDSDGRLDSFGGVHVVTLHNQTKFALTHICAALFPSSMYAQGYGSTTKSSRAIYIPGSSWGGYEKNLRQFEMCGIHLMPMGGTVLNGNMSVISPYLLYAPPEPDPAPDAIFYSGRLTITYRDSSDRPMAVIFDIDARNLSKNIDTEWRRVAGPQPVQGDLFDQSMFPYLENRAW